MSTRTIRTIRPVENFSSVQCCFTRTIRILLGRWKIVRFSSLLLYVHKDHKNTIRPVENCSIQFSSLLLYVHKDHKDTIRPMENGSVWFNVVLRPQRP